MPRYLCSRFFADFDFDWPNRYLNFVSSSFETSCVELAAKLLQPALLLGLPPHVGHGVLCTNSIGHKIRNLRTDCRVAAAAASRFVAIMPVWIDASQWVVVHVGVEVEGLGVVELGVGNRVFLGAPVGRHEAAHVGAEVPGPEVVVS